MAAALAVVVTTVVHAIVTLASVLFALLLMHVVRWATGLGWWESFALVALGRVAMLGIKKGAS